MSGRSAPCSSLMKRAAVAADGCQRVRVQGSPGVRTKRFQTKSQGVTAMIGITKRFLNRRLSTRRHHPGEPLRTARIDVDVGTADRFQWQRRAGQLWLVDTRPDPNAFSELTEITFGRFMRLTRPFWDAPLVREVHVTHLAT